MTDCRRCVILTEWLRVARNALAEIEQTGATSEPKDLSHQIEFADGMDDEHPECPCAAEDVICKDRSLCEHPDNAVVDGLMPEPEAVRMAVDNGKLLLRVGELEVENEQLRSLALRTADARDKACETSAEYYQRACKAERERDEARAEVERLRDDATCAADQLAEALNQRDEQHQQYVNDALRYRKAIAAKDEEIERLKDLGTHYVDEQKKTIEDLRQQRAEVQRQKRLLTTAYKDAPIGLGALAVIRRDIGIADADTTLEGVRKALAAKDAEIMELQNKIAQFIHGEDHPDQYVTQQEASDLRQQALATAKWDEHWKTHEMVDGWELHQMLNAILEGRGPDDD